MGAPGSGKGTQAAAIANRYGIPVISTGNIFRAAVASGSELGQQVSELLTSGQLVPDALTDAVVAARLSEPDVVGGWLLDGYPRTLSQVAALDVLLSSQGEKLDVVVTIDVPFDELVERVVRRGEIEGRSDDSRETAQARLQVYTDQTKPVIDAYAERGIVRSVDGVGAISEIEARISAVLAD
jgi:adenylate kinase